jgi:hypothetical protein
MGGNFIIILYLKNYEAMYYFHDDHISGVPCNRVIVKGRCAFVPLSALGNGSVM